MGVPSEKADKAAWSIYVDAKYLLDEVDPSDIYDDAKQNLAEAMVNIAKILEKLDTEMR